MRDLKPWQIALIVGFVLFVAWMGYHGMTTPQQDLGTQLRDTGSTWQQAGQGVGQLVTGSRATPTPTR